MVVKASTKHHDYNNTTYASLEVRNNGKASTEQHDYDDNHLTKHLTNLIWSLEPLNMWKHLTKFWHNDKTFQLR